MDAPKHGLTLTTVKDLLQRASGTTLIEDDPFDYASGGFDVPRNVRAVEKDGILMVVRYGTAVFPTEAETTLLVASRTNVPVPDIYGVFSEPAPAKSATITYIVEERIPGANLRTVLPTLDDAARDTVAQELRAIVAELATLTPLRDRLGPIRGPWANAYFRYFEHRVGPCGEDDARDTESFLRYFIKVGRSHPVTRDRASDRILDSFDLSRPHIFSHGDLQLTNIMVHDGHVSGIVDWAEAGWYPYFWDAFVLRKSVFKEFPVYSWWEPMVRQFCDPHMPEAFEMWILQNLAEDAQ